jgi:hypothetical protein
MDTRWQTETDQRLDALQRQLGATRRFASMLAIAVVALLAWSVYSAVHNPTKLVLEDRGTSLTLAPGEVRLQWPNKSSAELGVDGLWVRDEGKGTMHLSSWSLDMMMGKARTSLHVVPDHASLELVSMTKDGHMVSVLAGTNTDTGELSVGAPHDHAVTLRADAEGGHVVGLGSFPFDFGSQHPIVPAATR